MTINNLIQAFTEEYRNFDIKVESEDSLGLEWTNIKGYYLDDEADEIVLQIW